VLNKKRLLGLAWVMLASAPAMAQDASAVQATQLASVAQRAAVVARAYAKPDAAASLADIAPKVHFEAVNPGEPAGDRLGAARRLAAAVVAQDLPAPRSIVDVGSFTGEFLEAFMQRFPQSHGQWTEPVTGNEDNARLRLARFGKQVDYVIGCPSRDISQGCVPRNVDVLITSWLSIHQNLDGIRRFHREAAARLPSGGWLVTLDHAGAAGPAWTRRLEGAREELASSGINAIVEGPPVHHADYATPSLASQLASLKDAGFTDVSVVWQRLDTVLLMARKGSTEGGQ
jgi:SAM-dependent methyltransferase